jgi:hypothetical protein
MKCYDFDFNKDVQCIININKNKKNLKLELKDSKWKLNLTAILFDDINLNDKSGKIFKITNKAKGLIINRDIELETEFPSSFYVSNDFLDYIENSNYFIYEKEKLCEKKH